MAKGRKFKVEFIDEGFLANHEKMIFPNDKGMITYRVYMNSVGYHTNDNFTEREIINAIEQDMIEEGYIIQ